MHEAALTELKGAERVLKDREQRGFVDRLRQGRALRDAKRQPHPAAKWLESARKYSAPELQGETLVADRLTEDDANELERIVKKKRELVNDEHAEPLTPEEIADWERILGTAAGGGPKLFARKRRDAAARSKIAQLGDERKVAGLQRQPLLAEPGAVQLPRFVYSWLVGDEARGGAWTLMDIGVLVAVSGAFANDDPSVFVGGRFEGERDRRTLIVPGGIGADIRLHGRIAGSPIEEGSGFVRVREALRVLALNRLVEVEQTVADLWIRPGKRAGTLHETLSR